MAVYFFRGEAIILYVYFNKGNGNFEPVRSFPSMLDNSKEIMITDKNNDGLLDVVVSSSFPWLLFYFQQADGSFKAQYWETNTTAYTVFTDLDHDNKEDMIMLYPSFEIQQVRIVLSSNETLVANCFLNL